MMDYELYINNIEDNLWFYKPSYIDNFEKETFFYELSIAYWLLIDKKIPLTHTLRNFKKSIKEINYSSFIIEIYLKLLNDIALNLKDIKKIIHKTAYYESSKELNEIIDFYCHLNKHNEKKFKNIAKLCENMIYLN